MMVIGFGSDGRKYVIDFIRDKLKLSEKTSTILELAERWRPSVIFWEENASVEGGEHIAEVLEKRGWAIAPRREPKGGGLYRKKKEARKGDGLFGRWFGERSRFPSKWLEYPQFLTPKNNERPCFIG